MTDYYADSSVLVKRHVDEIGSDWFRALVDPGAGNVIITSRVSIVEVFSGFNRRMREAGLNPSDYAQVAADFTFVNGTEYQIVELTDQIAEFRIDDTTLCGLKLEGMSLVPCPLSFVPNRRDVLVLNLFPSR